MALLQGLVFQTIYGVLAFAVAVYFLAKWLKSRFDIQNKNLEYSVAGLAFVIAILTFHSIPRYQFDASIEEEIRHMPWAKVMERSTEWEVFEPLTWLIPPVNQYRIVMLDEPLATNSFRLSTHTYDKAPAEQLIDTDCTSHSYVAARLDTTSNQWVEATDSQGFAIHHQMTPHEYAVLCQHDWKAERTALREQLVKGR